MVSAFTTLLKLRALHRGCKIHPWAVYRSNTQARLRRFFGVDVECTVVGTLYALAEKNLIERKVVAQAIKDLGLDPEMVQPQIV